jgi:hypothetical protein
MNGPDQVPIKVVKREIAFSASASHNNIVQLIDVFAEKAQLVIVVSAGCPAPEHIHVLSHQHCLR